MSHRPRHALVVLVALVAAACGTSGEVPSDDVHAGSAGGSVWVANEGSDSLTVLDADTGRELAALNGIGSPHNVQAAGDGSSVWAVSGNDQLVAFDGSSLDITGLAMTDRHPAHVVADDDGRVYVTSHGMPSVYAYSPRLQPEHRTELAGAPHGLRLTGDGSTAVVANTGGGTVDIVDTATGQLGGRIAVGESPVQVALDDAGTVAFVSLAGTSEIARVDLATQTVTHRAPVPAAPAQVLLTAGGHLLSANQGTSQTPGTSVSVLDTSNLTTVAELETGAGPHGLTSDATGSRAWVTNTFDGTVTELDLVTMTPVRTVTVGTAPNGISFSPVSPAGAGDVELTLPHREDRGSDGGAGHDH